MYRSRPERQIDFVTWLALVICAGYLFFSRDAAAQTTQCVCSNSTGCSIASAPFDPVTMGSGAPTSCVAMKGGVQVGSANIVPASSVPLSNATVCLPADSAYVPGPPTNMACLVPIPQQSNNTTITVTLRYANAGGQGPDSPGLTFQSVQALTTIPTLAPTGLRVAK